MPQPRQGGIPTPAMLAIVFGASAVPGLLCILLAPTVGAQTPVIATLCGALAATAAVFSCRTLGHTPATATPQPTADRPRLPTASTPDLSDLVAAMREPVRDLRSAADCLPYGDAEGIRANLRTIHTSAATLTGMVERLFQLSRTRTADTHVGGQDQLRTPRPTPGDPGRGAGRS